MLQLLIPVAVAVAATPAWAAGESSAQGNLDLVWVLLAAALVFLMQAGFMCVESGLARAKNSINVAVKNLTDFVVAVAAFWVVGFGIMFGVSNGGLFGTSGFVLESTDPWVLVFFVFQAVFVGTAATIDGGAVAERTSFRAYLTLSLVTSALIYPVFGHWVWGGALHEATLGADALGWLQRLGFHDFAGSSVVHSVGGWVALAGIVVIGPRIGKFDAEGKPRRIQPSNLPLVYLGVFILFFGWFGFNCGSTLAATKDVAHIAFNTLLAAVFAGLATAATSYLHTGRIEAGSPQTASSRGW